MDIKNELHFLPLCSPLPQAWGLESYTKVPVLNQEQLQSFERRFEVKCEPDEGYQWWINIYHPQNIRKFPADSNGVNSHMYAC